MIRSNFIINESEFDNIYSDALDSDFSNGLISSTKFNYIGNDGIDTSGSTIDIRDIHIVSAFDKGISIGEKSTVIGSDIEITDSGIAVSAKD